MATIAENSTLQTEIARVADDLADLDHQLEILTLDPTDENPLQPHLLGGVAAVRNDLLSDAIQSLRALAELTGESAQKRYLEALDLAERIHAFRRGNCPVLSDPEALVVYLATRRRRPDQVTVGAIFLDPQLRVLAEMPIFHGTVERAAVEPRPILRLALEYCATSVILWQSATCDDELAPDASTLAMARRMSKALERIDVTLEDYLILGPDDKQWTSLRRQGGWR